MQKGWNDDWTTVVKLIWTKRPDRSIEVCKRNSMGLLDIGLTSSFLGLIMSDNGGVINQIITILPNLQKMSWNSRKHLKMKKSWTSLAKDFSQEAVRNVKAI